MFGFGQLIGILKKSPKKIVFTEGEDSRILEASSRLLASNFLHPILIGNEEKIMNAAEESGFNIRGAEIIDPEKYEKMDEMVEILCELRKKKGMTPEKARQVLSQANYFGTMLVKMGVADSLLGGATYSTADTVRPALQIIKTKPGISRTSGVFLMNRETTDQRLIFADCAINIEPDEQELAEIAINTADTTKIFDIDPKIAMLSFSTKGSAKASQVEKVQEATRIAKELRPEIALDGELQFDAAFVPTTAKIKAPESDVAGQANVFIFPDLQSGNIGYKIAQRLGMFDAIGPILQGLNMPVNDLSRGSSAEDIYKLAIITAAQTLDNTK